MLVPEPGSRRLYAGCRLGRKQAPPRLVPRPKAFSVSTSLRAFDASSTVHFRSSSPVLTWRPLMVAFSATLTTPAVVPAQLAVVWSLPLRGRLRGAYPHRQHGITSGRPIYIGSTLDVRGATFAPLHRSCAGSQPSHTFPEQGGTRRSRQDSWEAAFEFSLPEPSGPTLNPLGDGRVPQGIAIRFESEPSRSTMSPAAWPKASKVPTSMLQPPITSIPGTTGQLLEGFLECLGDGRMWFERRHRLRSRPNVGRSLDLDGQ
jgi:hypothetical protein